MTFQEHLAEISAPELVRILGCPRATAYQWKDGRRMPPEWQQPHWLRILAAASKRHNKTVIATDTSRSATKAGSKRKRG